jgi:DNA-binding transcriptional regulator YiaG
MAATAVHSRGSLKRAAMGRKTSAEDLTTYTGQVGARVRKRREQLGVTVDELADACQVTAKTVYAWEAGHNPIPINALPLIAAKLGTSPKRLLPDR